MKTVTELHDLLSICIPCHHGTVGPQVADGHDNLQMWKETANTLNMQSQISWGFYGQLMTPNHENQPVAACSDVLFL